MGHVLPEEKSIWIALTTIYGIGRERSRKILDQLKINYMKKVKDVTEEENFQYFVETKVYSHNTAPYHSETQYFERKVEFCREYHCKS